jgi:hypothetical protein
MSGPHPWVICGRDGSVVFCETRADWLAEWHHRIRGIEAAFRPVARRREGLERALAVNAAAFRALVQYGAADAVLDTTEAVVEADMRLARLARG